jgi:hypothetical protein
MIENIIIAVVAFVLGGTCGYVYLSVTKQLKETK